MPAILFLFLPLLFPAGPAGEPLFESELIFPLEHWHNHASSVVELPGGDLLVCWYHGSGERTADDVVVLGARKRKGSTGWSRPFLMADVPGFPDTNPTLFLDPRERLWLLWPVILANEWHTALMHYRISTDYQGEGAPRWEAGEPLLIKPGDRFLQTVQTRSIDLLHKAPAESRDRLHTYLKELESKAGDKFYRRLGWMTRAHPLALEGGRIIVPLYSDGFSFSLMAISDDGGRSWFSSAPLVGLGGIQPSLVQKKDGRLVAYMRDNGPPPKRLQLSASADGGETWGPVVDSNLPNPGAGAEIIRLRSGEWLLVYNDLERGRYSLAAALSDDEGRSWKWRRHIERDEVGNPEEGGQYHYPSIVEGGDGSLHLTYSYFLPPSRAGRDEQGRPLRKAVKYVHFNLDWLRADP